MRQPQHATTTCDERTAAASLLRLTKEASKPDSNIDLPAWRRWARNRHVQQFHRWRFTSWAMRPVLLTKFKGMTMIKNVAGEVKKEAVDYSTTLSDLIIGLHKQLAWRVGALDIQDQRPPHVTFALKGESMDSFVGAGLDYSRCSSEQLDDWTKSYLEWINNMLGANIRVRMDRQDLKCSSLLLTEPNTEPEVDKKQRQKWLHEMHFVAFAREYLSWSTSRQCNFWNRALFSAKCPCHLTDNAGKERLQLRSWLVTLDGTTHLPLKLCADIILARAWLANAKFTLHHNHFRDYYCELGGDRLNDIRAATHVTESDMLEISQQIPDVVQWLVQGRSVLTPVGQLMMGHTAIQHADLVLKVQKDIAADEVHMTAFVGNIYKVCQLPGSRLCSYNDFVESSVSK